MLIYLNFSHFTVQLTKDLAELDVISGQLTRPRNIDAISLQKKRVETELTNLRELLNAENAVAGKSATAPKPTSVEANIRRYECEITNYAWDQSDKYVKLFIGLDHASDAAEENVVVTFTPNSILLKISDILGKDYKFTINNLLHEIDVSASYRKIKTNSIAIYAKKATESKYSVVLCDDIVRSVNKGWINNGLLPKFIFWHQSIFYLVVYGIIFFSLQ